MNYMNYIYYMVHEHSLVQLLCFGMACQRTFDWPRNVTNFKKLLKTYLFKKFFF